MKKVAYSLLAIFMVICIAVVAMIRSDIPVEELKEQYANDHSKFIKIDGMDVHYPDEGHGVRWCSYTE